MRRAAEAEAAGTAQLDVRERERDAGLPGAGDRPLRPDGARDPGARQDLLEDGGESPIPLALLGIDETRQMGICFLCNYAALVLGYGALGFVFKLLPTMLQMANVTRFLGGDGEMILSIVTACILELFFQL